MNRAPMRAVIYSRVSRDDTGEGRSNDRQEEDCRKLAELRGWEVVEVCRDVSISAYSNKRKRPGWERVLELMDSSSVEVVIAWKMDRVTRTVGELSSIIAKCRAADVALATVDGDLDLSNETGKMVATILGAVAEQEVERKAARQRSANAQRRSEGQPWRTGWVSFGYTREKQIVPEQADLIRKAADAVLSGASLNSVAKSWRELGVSTPRSSKGADGWTHNGIRSILLNPVNAGILTYKGEEIGAGGWEPILSESTLRQLQAFLGDPSRRTYASNGRKPQTLLSGIATCGTCGARITAGVSNGRKVYKCSDRSSEHLTTNRELADEFVLEAVTKGEAFASHRVLPDVANVAGQDEVVAELAALDRREGLITEQFGRGAIGEDTWTRALAEIGKQREGLNARLAESVGERLLGVALARARVENFLSLSLAERRATLGAATEIVLHSRNHRRNRPIAEQVTVWAKGWPESSKRLSPLVAGTYPESVAESARRVELRIQTLHADARD